MTARSQLAAPVPRLLVLSLLLLATSSRTTAQPRIVGGVDCERPENAFMVMLLSGSTCGGSVIRLDRVLTAAHCVVDRQTVRDAKIYARTIITKRMKDSVQMRLVVDGIVHPKFSFDDMFRQVNPELRYDIAVLKLERPFLHTPSLRTIPLPKPGAADSCQKALVLGYGLQYQLSNKRSSGTLMCVELHLVNKSVCLKTYKSVIDDSLICTMESTDGLDSCEGDSGGPMICHGVVIGVVSIGMGCANANVSSIYTKVESYLDFISGALQTLSKGTKKLTTTRRPSSNAKERIDGKWRLLETIWVFIAGLVLRVCFSL